MQKQKKLVKNSSVIFWISLTLLYMMNILVQDTGEPSDSMIEATKLLAKKEAILLDPVYSGKGFAGLIGLIKNKTFTKNDNVLFIHTGGAVSLSAYEWAF